METLSIVILSLAALNIVRLAVYSISSNLQMIRQYTDDRHKGDYWPRVSVVVPAHNEGAVIQRTLSSLIASDYPRSQYEIIVADDGSTDDTAARVNEFIALHRIGVRIRIVTRPNRGKAEALNYAIKTYASGSLIMCLDADSLVHPDCLKNSVLYFRDPKVVATASNVNIMENGTWLGMAQRFEYLFSHHFKRAHTFLNMEYIIGGVGSTFRKSILKQVEFYDSDTMTEDIDLTMKIIQMGNKEHRVVFAADAITYTEPVLTYRGLINQRFRWKFGRLQTFYKNRNLFFNTNGKYSRQLTMVLLPMTILYEILMLLEPLVIAFVVWFCITHGSISTVLWAATIFVTLLTMNIWASDHVSRKDRLRLSLFAPAMYIVLYALIFVEYAAGMKSALRLSTLRRSLKSEKTTWVSPTRNPNASL